MDIRAVLFDVNGTLVDILTDDGAEEVFRAASHFLTYQGIHLHRGQVRDHYFAAMKAQRAASAEQHPEFDAVRIWQDLVEAHATAYTHALPPERLAQVPLALAELTRGVARRRLRLYPHVAEVLDVLRRHFPLAVVTDGQSAWARAELHRVGLDGSFDPVVVSGDHGFRKPDPRLFTLALDALGVDARQAVYVGNDMYRDVFGAGQLGMTTVLLDSDQGVKHHPGTLPDFRITDPRALLPVLGIVEPVLEPPPTGPEEIVITWTPRPPAPAAPPPPTTAGHPAEDGPP